MLNFINNIMPRPDYKAIFSRLGYKHKQTELNEAARKEIINWIDEAASFMNLKGVVLECNFEAIEQGKIMIDPCFWDEGAAPGRKSHESSRTEKIEILSSSFYKFILGAKKIFLMGITGGKEVMDFIETEQKKNMTKAVVLDAAAGEITDTGLDYIVSFYNKGLIRKSEKLFPKRFSPGYGDLLLETQKIFYDLLEMKKIGVDITENFMLIPQKSVIALTGIV